MDRVLFRLLIVSGFVLLPLLLVGAGHAAAVAYAERLDPGILSWGEDPAWRPLMIGSFPVRMADTQMDLERAFGSPSRASDGTVVWGERTSNSLYISDWNVTALVDAEGRVLEVSSAGGITPQPWVEIMALCALATFAASGLGLLLLRLTAGRTPTSAGHV